MGEHRHGYAALDGLRGLAAISVIFFHFDHWFGKAWLACNAGFAVDFFFCLSGFIVSVAYQKKIAGDLTAGTFAVIRLIRLMPMIVISTLIGAAYMAARLALLHDAAIRPGHLALATLLGLLCIPFLAADKAIGGPQIFPLNGPQYTLFLEIFVNLVWVLVARWMTLGGALVIALVGYAIVAAIGLGGDTGSSFVAGFPRVFGAYYAGVAVYFVSCRYPLAAGSAAANLVFVLCAIGTLAFFYWPVSLPLAAGLAWSMLVAPLLIFSGSGFQLPAGARAVALRLGALSYPIYALHFPVFMWINAIYQQLTHRKDFLPEAAMILCGVLAASWLLLRIVDEPARAFLTSRLTSRKA